MFTPVSAESKKKKSPVKTQPRTTISLKGMAGMSSWPTWQTMMTPDENDLEHRIVGQKRLNISYPEAQMARFGFFLYIYCEILNAMKVERHLLTVTRSNKAQTNPNHVTMKPEQFLPSGQTSMTWERTDGHVRTLSAPPSPWLQILRTISVDVSVPSIRGPLRHESCL